jgi:hypothetical protein
MWNLGITTSPILVDPKAPLLKMIRIQPEHDLHPPVALECVISRLSVPIDSKHRNHLNAYDMAIQSFFSTSIRILAVDDFVAIRVDG